MDEIQSTDSGKVIPFKLCFSEKKIPGRSNVHIGRPLHLPQIISEKVNKDNTIQDEKSSECIQKYIQKLIVDGPRTKYQKPVTENQKYGWYNHVRFNDNQQDKRLNHHKQTDNLIMEHLMNYAQIRP